MQRSEYSGPLSTWINLAAPRGTISAASGATIGNDVRCRWSACMCEISTASHSPASGSGAGPRRRRRCAIREVSTGSVRSRVPFPSIVVVAWPHHVTRMSLACDSHASGLHLRLDRLLLLLALAQLLQPADQHLVHRVGAYGSLVQHPASRVHQHRLGLPA